MIFISRRKRLTTVWMSDGQVRELIIGIKRPRGGDLRSFLVEKTGISENDKELYNPAKMW